MSRISRFLIVIAFFALPLTAQPFPLAPPPVGPSPGNVLGSGAASNGNVYLAAWAEARSGAVQIRGIHIGTGGTPVEATSFRISPVSDASGEGLVSAPAVASNGTNFVVVWVSRSRLYAALVLPSAEVRVLTTTIDARSVQIVWGGTSYVVLHETSAGALAATLIDFDGTLLAGGVAVATSSSGISSPSLAADKDGRAMAFWYDLADGDAHVADVSVNRIFSGGISSVGLQSPRTVTGRGVIASDGVGFLAVWAAYPLNPLSTSFSILSRPMDSSGAASGPVQTVAADVPPLNHPLLFWNGQNYLLADANGSISAQALNGDGTPTAAGPYLITTQSGSLKKAEALLIGDFQGSTKTFLVWDDFRFGHAEVFGQVSGTDAMPLSDEIVVSVSPASQSAVGAVWTGSDYLALWIERAGVSRIMAARAKERIPIVIANPQLTGSAAGNAAVAVAAGKAVIVWVEVAAPGFQQSALYRATLANGAFSASAPAAITPDVRDDTPTIATNGQTFAVAWTTQAGEIAVTTIDASGNTAAPVTLTSKPFDTFNYSSPRLAWAGDIYVLVRQRTLTDGRIIIEMQRLSAALAPIGLPVPLTDSNTAMSVSVTSGFGALVTWTQNGSVRASRVSGLSFGDPPLPSGTLLDPINGVTIVSGTPVNGAVAAWDGKSWRIGAGDKVVTLLPVGGISQSVPTAPGIAAIAGGGSLPFVVFNVEDITELTTRVFGQFLNDVPLRHRAARK